MLIMKLLLIEDELKLSEALTVLLKRSGYTVDTALDGLTGLKMACTNLYDVIILDRMLPHLDGLSALKQMKKTGVTAPILFLTAKDAPSDRVEGLNAGADDYLVKPFGVPELVARIRALLRRSQFVSNTDVASSRIRFGNVAVDLATHEVMRDGRPVHLTPIEFRLLTSLIRGHGKVLTHKQLLRDTWGAPYTNRPHYLRVYMMQLRQKLENDLSQPEFLLTELQVGYRLSGMTIEGEIPANAPGSSPWPPGLPS